MHLGHLGAFCPILGPNGLPVGLPMVSFCMLLAVHFSCTFSGPIPEWLAVVGGGLRVYGCGEALARKAFRGALFWDSSEVCLVRLRPGFRPGAADLKAHSAEPPPFQDNSGPESSVFLESRHPVPPGYFLLVLFVIPGEYHQSTWKIW